MDDQNEHVCQKCGWVATVIESGQTCLNCGGQLNEQGRKARETKGDGDPTLAPHSGSPDEAEQSGLTDSEFGDYVLIEEIARGGMGVVYKARHKSLDRIVALKMILEGKFASQVEVDRFKIEAQAAAHLDHPGIVPVYDQGMANGRHYFSMAFVDGESLAEKLTVGTMTGGDAAGLLLKIAKGVSYAHERGIVHRDLKPANILIDLSGEPRIADFGLAKRPDRNSGLTLTGQMLGTPSYMAPEQASGLDEITTKTDVYALGAILYAMLTGKPPFHGASLIDTISKVMEQDPVPPTQTDASIDQDLETICLKCLEKDPAERYESSDALIAELNRYLKGEPIEARPLSGIGKLIRWRRVIARNRNVRLRSVNSIAGIPWVDIAFGHDREKNEEFGSARGIVAIGDRATGIFAYGRNARGIFSMGMYSIGVVSFGMFSTGIFSLGMFSLGVVVAGGGIAAGFFSFGLVSIGVFSMGFVAFGWKAMGALGWSWIK